MKNQTNNFAQGIRGREAMDGFTVAGDALGVFLCGRWIMVVDYFMTINEIPLL
jgi:hypothetical protein